MLIDSGSNNNFIALAVEERLKLKKTATEEFRVGTGSSVMLYYKSKCYKVNLKIQGYDFCIDLLVLEIRGSDIVLGVQWLIELGTIMTNYSDLTMEFMLGGKQIKIQGEDMMAAAPLKGKTLNKLMRGDSISGCFQLQVVEIWDPGLKHLRESQINEEASAVLQQYKGVFDEPKILPLVQEIDHRIPLDPGAKPISVRPYRYPQFQKSEIERLVKEMLAVGIIRDSRSPFSSPVLLVKKKDGSWHFCIDYQGLNSITTKDKFPILTIDEILDQLEGSTYFSKLDLRSCYHQIRMWEPDIHKIAFRTYMGHYEFLVMPFGLTNAPSTFQASMNKVFHPYLRKFVAIFFMTS